MMNGEMSRPRKAPIVFATISASSYVRPYFISPCITSIPIPNSIAVNSSITQCLDFNLSADNLHRIKKPAYIIKCMILSSSKILSNENLLKLEAGTRQLEIIASVQRIAGM
jgi:hypothetical protein